MTIGFYSEVYDFGRTAVERFGNSPDPFKSNLELLKGNYAIDFITKDICKNSTELNDRLVVPTFCSAFGNSYINTLIAIVQVNLEKPGFIDEFPEAKLYVSLDYKRYLIFDRYVEKFTNIYAGYNRYSHKFDLKSIKRKFNIPDIELRPDDYISSNFKMIYTKTKSPKVKDYLFENFVYQSTLMPEDFKEILKAVGKFEEKEVSDSNYWIDEYFKYQKEIIENLNVHSLSPDIMRKINLTLIS